MLVPLGGWVCCCHIFAAPSSCPKNRAEGGGGGPVPLIRGRADHTEPGLGWCQLLPGAYRENLGA